MSLNESTKPKKKNKYVWLLLDIDILFFYLL
jgi:hypothetical protein